MTKDDSELLGQSVGFSGSGDVTAGIADALHAFLETPGQGRDALAREILEESRDASAVLAALTAMARPIASVRAPRASIVAPIRERLDALLSGGRFPVASLLGHATRVQMTTLGNEDKARVADGVLLINETSLEELADTGLPAADLEAAGLLYVVHEVVHLEQGIGDKARVTDLRAAGAETTLMHLDLGADHLAARLLAEAVPAWDLAYLKDIQGRSLVAFPAGVYHTTAARARKAQRLVGLRLDLLARLSGAIPADTNEYAFGDFGPAGGRFVILRSGPPMGVVGVGSLTAKDADTLFQSASAGATGLAAVDAILRGVLAGMR